VQHGLSALLVTSLHRSINDTGFITKVCLFGAVFFAAAFFGAAFLAAFFFGAAFFPGVFFLEAIVNSIG
jgi:hypothetical protein